MAFSMQKHPNKYLKFPNLMKQTIMFIISKKYRQQVEKLSVRVVKIRNIKIRNKS